MLQKTKRPLSWVEQATTVRHKFERFRVMQELFLPLVAALERLIDRGLPLTNASIAQEMGLGENAQYYYPIWQGNPVFRSIIERYARKMSPKYATAVRFKVRRREAERKAEKERLRLQALRIKFTAEHFGPQYVERSRL